MSDSRNITGRAARPAPVESPDAAARFTHELANLLDGSLRQLSLALSELTDDAPARHPADGTVRRLEAASAALVRMAQLLKRWASSAGSADPASLFNTDATLAESVGYVQRLIEPRLTASAIDLHVDLPDDLAPLQAGPIYHVLANAVRNAAEAIGDGPGGIQITFRRDDRSLVLIVADDGAGLDPNLPRDAHGHIRPGATTKPTGRGLGLAVSRQIVESLGGTLTLADRPTHGAILTARWPLPSPHDAAP